jgi:hypothetical protein
MPISVEDAHRALVDGGDTLLVQRLGRLVGIDRDPPRHLRDRGAAGPVGMAATAPCPAAPGLRCTGASSFISISPSRPLSSSSARTSVSRCGPLDHSRATPHGHSTTRGCRFPSTALRVVRRPRPAIGADDRYRAGPHRRRVRGLRPPRHLSARPRSASPPRGPPSGHGGCRPPSAPSRARIPAGRRKPGTCPDPGFRAKTGITARDEVEERRDPGTSRCGRASAIVAFVATPNAYPSRRSAPSSGTSGTVGTIGADGGGAFERPPQSPRRSATEDAAPSAARSRPGFRR